MRRGALILAALLAVLLGWSAPGAAQLPLPPPAASSTGAGTGTEVSISPLARLTAWIATQQRTMHRELVRGMRALTQSHTLTAVWTLILGSFLYGVFHAVGPGHGKAIIATYLATQPYRLRRGLWLSVAGAGAQGLTAIVLVYGVVVVAGRLPRDTQSAVDWSERASFALVVLIGAGLAWRAARALFGGGHEHHHHEHHHHEHRHDDHQAHGHDHDAHCGHVHAPTGAMIERAVDWRSTLGIVASIGLRPCTGAILVLVLATTLGLHAAGIAAVLAMSAGTALALGALGVIVIQARSWAVGALAGRGGDGRLRLERLTHGLALVGGCLVALLGASLLSASFGPAHPLGL